MYRWGEEHSISGKDRCPGCAIKEKSRSVQTAQDKYMCMNLHVESFLSCSFLELTEGILLIAVSPTVY